MLDAIELMGSGSLPIILFVLGATLSSGVSGLGSSLPSRTLVAIVCAKLLVVPAVNLALVLGALRYGLLPRTDPVLLPLALLAVGASPTAMNLSTIAQLAGSGQGEVTKVIFFQYIFAVITVSVYATLGLLLFGVGGP
jgi:predicted permease